jgi:hypothetical protein
MKWIAALLASLALAGCGEPTLRARTVDELALDPPVLQGIVSRCEADKRAAATDPECLNARLAAERLARAEDTKHDVDHDREFERQRELRRERDEAQRRAAAQKEPAFDPYSSPVAADPSSTASKP